MKLQILFLLIVTLSCSKSITKNNTSKDIYNDSIADLTILNGSFYTTNYDISGNSGSQIDLIKFEDLTYPEDSFDLAMNGQGYLAITNDGSDIYLQSKTLGNIFKVSVLGERVFTKTDTLSSNWQPSGITYNNDINSLILVHRNLDNLKEYRIRALSKDLDQPATLDYTFSIDNIDTTYYGAYSIDYHNSKYYMLAVNNMGEDIILQLENNEISNLLTVLDTSIVGICINKDIVDESDKVSIFGSYESRTIKKIIDLD